MNMTLITVLAALMIAIGAGFIYYVVRENEKPIPKGGVQWAAVSLSVLLMLFSTFLLALTLASDAPDVVGEGGTDPLPGEMNQPAPDFTFRHVTNDEPQTLAAYKGDVILLNFWATWCAPCIAELPELNRLQQTYGEQGLVVLTISDEQRQELLAFEEEVIPLRTVTGYVPDPEALPQPFRRTLAIRPTSYVIDREGTIRMFWKGAGDYSFFEQAIVPYLEQDVAAR